MQDRENPGATFHVRRVVLLGATVLAGLSAGFFFTYQISVVRALREVDAGNYVATFRAINETVQNPAFGLVFFGSIPAQTAVVVLLGRARDRAVYAAATALVLTLVVVGVTGAGNVPLNDELASLTEPIAPATASLARVEFEDDWNRLNLVRMLASLGSFVAMLVAVALRPRPTARS